MIAPNGIISRTNNLKHVPALVSTAGNVTSAHYIGVASMFNILPKKCSKCGEWKDKSEFHKNKLSRDGLKSVCKSCRSMQENGRITDAAREKRRLTSKAWYQSNREAAYQNTKNWIAAHPEKRKEISKKYWQSNPERHVADTRNRRARIRGNGGKITEKEWQALKKFYNYTCLCCHRQEPEIKLTLDHVKPLIMGGKNIIENAQPLCLSCNSGKGGRWVDYR